MVGALDDGVLYVVMTCPDVARVGRPLAMLAVAKFASGPEIASAPRAAAASRRSDRLLPANEVSPR